MKQIGFLPKHTELRIPRSAIATSARLKLIEVKAGNRQCWLPVHKIGVKFWNLPRFTSNDTFIDTVNAEIQHFVRKGVYPSLYIGKISADTKVFENALQARKNKNKSDACRYIIDGFYSSEYPINKSYYIRVVENNIPASPTGLISSVFVSYLKHFIDQNKVLTTNVAYVLPDGTMIGKEIYGRDFMGFNGYGTPNCADVLFYGDPAVDVDETAGAIILKPGVASASEDDLTYVRRSGPQPAASNFCYVAMMAPGKTISRPIKIKNAEIKFTFVKQIEDKPNIVQKGRTVGRVPPGA